MQGHMNVRFVQSLCKRQISWSLRKRLDAWSWCKCLIIWRVSKQVNVKNSVSTGVTSHFFYVSGTSGSD